MLHLAHPIIDLKQPGTTNRRICKKFIQKYRVSDHVFRQIRHGPGIECTSPVHKRFFPSPGRSVSKLQNAFSLRRNSSSTVDELRITLLASFRVRL